MTPRTIFTLLLALPLLAAPALAGYTSGGTFVAKAQGATVLDNGGVICEGLTGNGIGGGCLPFPTGGREPVFIRVHDATAASAVAFQVCIDNNGDGVCGGQAADVSVNLDSPGGNVTVGGCRDQIFFSHADGGRFFNALGPLPKASLAGCADAFQGYIVLLCEGVHEDREAGPHTHALTTGTIGFAPEGSGYGDFCGGGGAGGEQGFANAAAKAYVIR